MQYTEYVESFNNGEQVYTFTTVPCPTCGQNENIEVKGPDLFRYRQGAFIQNAFPYLSAAQRERLMSGVCGPCWDKLWE